MQLWCEENKIPYVTSWGAMPHLAPSKELFQGSIGVYGSRHANWCIQASDKILVLGSRLDNRQRTGNPHGFAPFASILVIDIDKEEIAKYRDLKNYSSLEFDLHGIDLLLGNFSTDTEKLDWLEELKIQKNTMGTGFEKSTDDSSLNPYFSTQVIQGKMEESSIAVSDCGANLCWIYQAWHPSSTLLFTSGGNSPMGYSLPASIGAQIANPGKKVYCFIGDGGFQMNVQELQTIVHYKLPIVIFIQNNFGYGIIKQFQDAYFEGRHFATGSGYSLPDFEKISNAYGINYIKINEMESLKNLTIPIGPAIIDLHFPENSLITPKTEMDRFIHDQFPYISDGSVEKLPFPYPERPSSLSNLTNPTV
jgi:acetolactate synthase-1/2/3 large subunit